jgi:hypothetical protein
MRTRAYEPFRKLGFEQLESRSMLSSGLSVLPGPGLPIDPTAIAVPALFSTATPGSVGSTATQGPVGNTVVTLTTTAAVPFNGNFNSLLGFDATSGNGQITLTTGANTPGISSFATPTNGISFLT